MGADRKGRGQALTGVRVGQVLSLEKDRILPVPTPSDLAEGRITATRDATGKLWTGGVLGPVHARRLFTRESGDPSVGHGRWTVVRAANPTGARQP